MAPRTDNGATDTVGTIQNLENPLQSAASTRTQPITARHAMTHTQHEPDCYFCEVSAGRADPLIFENRSFVGVFDTHPVNPGHALIIPRRHVVSLFELDEMEQSDYFHAIHGVRQVVETTDLTDLYRNMLIRGDLRERPKDHIETVLNLPFLGNQPDAYTVGNNDGRAAGRSIDHLHVILLPRYIGDVLDPRGGIRNVIPDRAKYHKSALGHSTTMGLSAKQVS